MACSPESPVIVCGCQRSGTTLLARVLQSHPRSAFGVEAAVLRYALVWFYDLATSRPAFRNLRMTEFLHTLERLGGATGAPDRQAIRRNAEQVLVSYLEDGRLEAWAEAMAREAFLRQLCYDIHTFGLEEPLFWGDKYPQYVFQLDAIQAIFPSARFVFLRRHPFDTMESLYRYRNDRQRPGGGMRFTIEDCRTQWEEWNLAWEFGKNRLDRRAVFELPYESLLGDPEGTLAALSDFIGAPLLDAAEVRAMVHKMDQRNLGKWRGSAHAGLVAGCARTPTLARLCTLYGYALDA
ncbi:MAG: sulfotransferase [bacterium]